MVFEYGCCIVMRALGVALSEDSAFLFLFLYFLFWIASVAAPSSLERFGCYSSSRVLLLSVCHTPTPSHSAV
jgi:hypothetical protein